MCLVYTESRMIHSRICTGRILDFEQGPEGGSRRTTSTIWVSKAVPGERCEQRIESYQVSQNLSLHTTQHCQLGPSLVPSVPRQAKALGNAMPYIMLLYLYGIFLPQNIHPEQYSRSCQATACHLEERRAALALHCSRLLRVVLPVYSWSVAILFP